MPDEVRIALIHATRVAVDPVEAAASEIWPEAELVSILEEGLALDRAKNAVPLSELNARIVDLARYAERLNPKGILYTCSAFGEGIEEAARTSELPVLKPNEAMFELAFAHGTDIAMIYTFPPAAGGMEREFKEEAERRGVAATLRSFLAEGALDALKAGDEAQHDKLIADAAAEIEGADAILLAQFSMAGAAPAVRKATKIPVLTSPEAAIEKLKRAIVAGTSGER